MDHADPTLARYHDWLAARAAADIADIAERQDWAGAWRYFHRRAGRSPKTDPAAVSAAGLVVGAPTDPGWFEFLAQPDLDAARLAERVLWLAWPMGQLLVPDDVTLPAELRARVEAPRREQVGADTLRLVFWAAHPPAVDDGFRVTVTATRAGPARFESP